MKYSLIAAFLVVLASILRYFFFYRKTYPPVAIVESVADIYDSSLCLDLSVTYFADSKKYHLRAPDASIELQRAPNEPTSASQSDFHDNASIRYIDQGSDKISVKYRRNNRYCKVKLAPSGVVTGDSLKELRNVGKDTSKKSKSSSDSIMPSVLLCLSSVVFAPWH